MTHICPLLLGTTLIYRIKIHLIYYFDFPIADYNEYGILDYFYYQRRVATYSQRLFTM